MSLMPLAPDVQTLDSAIHRINHYPPDNSILVLLVFILWIVIYLAPVVQKVDNAIHRINHYPLDIAILLVSLLLIQWIAIYPVDSAIHRLNNWGLVDSYPSFEQLGPVLQQCKF